MSAVNDCASAGAGIRGHIDAPAAGQVLPSGQVVVSGWAVGASCPVSRVEVWLDGRFQGCAGLGRPRTDVAAALQDDDAELSGFEFRFDSRRLDRLGDRALVGASVILLDGTRADLPPVRISIAPAIDSQASPLAWSSERTPPEPPRRRLRQQRVRLLCVARSLDHGGSQLRMRELMTHLQTTEGFETTVMSPTEGPLRCELEAAGTSVHVAPIPIDDISAYEKQLAIATAWADGKFDVVLAFTLTSFPAIELAWRLGLPSVWRIGENEPLATVVAWLGGKLDPSVELRAKSAFDMASAVRFISESTLLLGRQTGFAGRSVVFGNGADVAAARAYVAATDRDTCRRNLGIGREQRVLVCAGTLWPVKGQALLVAALERVRPDHPGLECILIGQQFDAYAAALSRFVDRHRLQGAVRFVPFCDDLRPWMRAVDVVACPSESEAMPTSVVEAMAFGLPVLAARVGGIPDIVEEGVTGWLCEPNDLGSLVEGVARVAKAKPGELRALGERAMARVAETHDRAKALSRMTDLLRHVMRGTQPRGLERPAAMRADDRWTGRRAGGKLPPDNKSWAAMRAMFSSIFRK
ncbi:MAG: D-inositol-3-phosphate glycosyltransferase [Alphaproteobacteria bacterium]|nr:D-inositol-3-phosphate glycosyltransferase [Alphaproteobacteria bacterium]